MSHPRPALPAFAALEVCYDKNIGNVSCSKWKPPATAAAHMAGWITNPGQDVVTQSRGGTAIRTPGVNTTVHCQGKTSSDDALAGPRAGMDLIARDTMRPPGQICRQQMITLRAVV